MRLWLLVPVKPLGEGKSRLATTLDSEQRAALSRQLLEGLLTMARDSAHFAGRLVISRDPNVRDIATASGAQWADEPGRGLNQALKIARDEAVLRGAGSILVLPSDLPWITSSDLARLVEAGEQGAAVVLAPSRDGGTNALLLNPSHAIDFAYGKGSYRRHLALAQRAELAVRTVFSPTLALDIDSPADLEILTAGQPAG